VGDIYTRTGDGGTTSLPKGTRVPKTDPVIEAFGALDEANCHIGLARLDLVDSELDRTLGFLQQRLFNCAAALGGSAVGVDAEDVAALEHAIDRYTARLGGFDGFVLPGSDESSARLHVARAVLRRAERAVVAAGVGDAQVHAFINRASDFLYVAARFSAGGADSAWDAEAPRP
jgi:cob(I)alamin adenosyltransferase